MEKVEKKIEIIGISNKSWDEAAKNAIESVSGSGEIYRTAKVQELDLKLDEGKLLYRANLILSQ